MLELAQTKFFTALPAAMEENEKARSALTQALEHFRVLKRWARTAVSLLKTPKICFGICKNVFANAL